MNGVPLKLSLLAVLVLWTTPSWGQFSPQAACQNGATPRTSIYYVNGVTTTLDEARLNGGKLEMEFLGKLPSLSPALKAKCYESLSELQSDVRRSQGFYGGRTADGWAESIRYVATAGRRGCIFGLVSVLQGPMTNANQIDQPAIERHGLAYRSKMADPTIVVGFWLCLTPRVISIRMRPMMSP